MPWSEGDFEDTILSPPGWFQPGAEPPPVSLPGWTEIRSLLAVANATGLTAKQLLWLICGSGTGANGEGLAHAALIPLLMKGVGNAGIGTGDIPGITEDMMHNLIYTGRILLTQKGISEATVQTIAAAVSKTIGIGAGSAQTPGTMTNMLQAANAIAAGFGSGPGTLVIPAQAPVTFQNLAAGTFTIDLPWWAMVPGVLIDYALLSGGRGGRGGAFLAGGGGGAGNWATGTLTYGTQIPNGQTQLQIVIAPQSPGSPGNLNPANPNPEPGPTILRLTNGTALATAAANTGESGSQNGATRAGVTYNGVTYPGGAGGTGNGGNATGNGAGGAGGNGSFIGTGSKGGNGSVGRSNLVIRQP